MAGLPVKLFLSVLLCLLLQPEQAATQNLFANPGLEDINICTEFHAPCAPEAWFYIRPATNPVVNGKVAPKPFSGTNMLLVPVHNVFGTDDSRSYVYTMLLCPLQAGAKYRLSFYINTAGRKFDHLDVYLSEKEPASRRFDVYGLAPTFSITGQNLVTAAKQDWKTVEYEFVAKGNEQFCMLGNLSSAMEYSISDRMNASGYVFYFLDDLQLVPLTPVATCENMEEARRKIYDQNYRHTDHVLVDPEIDKPKMPVFKTDTVTVPAVFFETNSALLKPAFKKIMDSLSTVLAGKKIAKISITGHTDSKGIPEKNKQLSLSRAEAIRNYFIERLPQYSDIVFAEGKGQDEPVADNTTEKGREKNRRVEIVLTVVETK